MSGKTNQDSSERPRKGETRRIRLTKEGATDERDKETQKMIHSGDK